MKKYNIAIVGLGLIGGSVCKAIKQNSDFSVSGYDIDAEILQKAVDDGVIDRALDLKDLCLVDICFVCLFPQATVDFVLNNIHLFKKEAIITDVCGIKGFIYDNINSAVKQNGLFYVGGHPMAGKEKSGYANSCADLLKNASYLLMKNTDTCGKAFDTVAKIAELFGSKVIASDTQTHDRIIAYTSQLAHAVSSCYVKSPTVNLEKGFTGGSFQDMTRVAFLDENMWQELFLLNKDNLTFEIDNIIGKLSELNGAIKQNDKNEILRLLKEGREIKAEHL